ncbi:MAG: M20/M25/M40 family metallo-hydrolase, partial [Candidatus Ranarchaeia archaeon]
SILFCFEGEEEIGSPSFLPFLKTHTELLDCDAILVGEGGTTKTGRTGVVGGYKGFLGVELSINSPLSEVHSSYAGIVDNPVWQLIHALGTLKNSDGHILIPHFYESIKRPSISEKAKFGLSGFALNRKKLEESLGIIISPKIGTGKALSALFFNPTLNINGINGGYPVHGGLKTIVPDRAHANLDARLVPGQDPEEIYLSLTRYLEHAGFSNVNVQKTAMLPPYVAPANDPFVKIVNKAIYSVFGSKIVKAPIAPGSGAFTWLPHILDAPMASAGSGAIYMAHRPNEFINVRQFLQGIKLFSEIYMCFADLSGTL